MTWAGLCRGCECNGTCTTGKGTGIAYDLIRTKVPRREDGRVLWPDIEEIRKLVESNEILDAVEKETGPLQLGRDVTDLPRPNVV